MTPADIPLACTLDAAGLAGRVAEMRCVGRTALRGAERAGARAQLRFAGDEPTRARLAALVAAEARCCAFLDLALVERADALVLTISGPAAAEPVVVELVAAFEGGR